MNFLLKFFLSVDKSNMAQFLKHRVFKKSSLICEWQKIIESAEVALVFLLFAE